MLNKGLSFVAEQIAKPWTKKKRPRKWRRKVYGLVVHTTGSGLPSKAKLAEEDPTARAVRYYLQSHGTHYVCGWGGIEEGQLIQAANEDQQANGVGVTNKDTNKSQWDSVYKRDWLRDLPHSMGARWIVRWSHTGATNPLELFPTKYVNTSYVHVEMPPCVFHHAGELITEAEPMAPGLRFTKAQHDAVIKLALDVAARNDWPYGWWDTGRLVGHEDVTPISRHVKSGGWDPGALRAEPWFDWYYIRRGIKAEIKKSEELGEVAENPKPPAVPSPVDESTLKALLDIMKNLWHKLVG
jgi:hypothetical protein